MNGTSVAIKLAIIGVTYVLRHVLDEGGHPRKNSAKPTECGIDMIFFLSCFSDYCSLSR